MREGAKAQVKVKVKGLKIILAIKLSPKPMTSIGAFKTKYHGLFILTPKRKLSPKPMTSKLLILEICSSITRNLIKFRDNRKHLSPCQPSRPPFGLEPSTVKRQHLQHGKKTASPTTCMFNSK
ncbi:hypothetical protein YC2023_049681 [Brassica napus]